MKRRLDILQDWLTWVRYMGRKRGKYKKRDRSKEKMKEPEVKAKVINYSVKKELEKIKDEIRSTVILWLFGSKYSEVKKVEDVSVRDVEMLTDFTANIIMNTKSNKRREKK